MTTTFKFVLRKRKKNNGTQAINLRITHNRKHTYISTGISVFENDWNPSKEEIRSKKHLNHKTLNETLRIKKKEAEQIHTDLSRYNKVSAKNIRERMTNSKKAEFFALGDALQEELEQKKKHSALQLLKVVLHKMEEFQGERTLPLRQMDTDYLDRFEEFLKSEYENGRNTINKNFEPIRKIIKRALKSHLINMDPFIGYEGAKRGRAKEKTKLSMKQIRDIEELPLDPESDLWHIRNAFLFSFYSGGIRFGDICSLKWWNVKNDHLNYKMEKNSKSFATPLNSYQKNILLNYSGEQFDYIFPFLNNAKEYDPLELRKAINSCNVMANGKSEKGNETGLKAIAKKAGIDENVTFHVSRHSFAQYAVQSKGLHVYDLMQALRHSKIETTQRYLKGLDESLADKAMKKVFGDG